MYIIKLLLFSVEGFKFTVKIENATDDSILVNWTRLDISAVDVNYQIIFNRLVAIVISSPPYLIKNLSDGEIYSVKVICIVRRRDNGGVYVMSDMVFVRTGEWQNV